ncbi:Xanthine dehydrogenase [Hypsibius exemplaris]|uniref:Xanthine dehydrogenase n=1 Tax=Hypsibius exemplaris TaxID=2072580 RepID=A0A1W0WT67_HYPEX|nr:Xanthine dehydrogenase [Hypsibius exemplaris]
MATAVVVTVNGLQYQVPNTYGEISLNEFLRKNLLLTGTKVMCREGGCGICVVYVEYPDPSQQGVVVQRSINSCLCPVLSCDGWSITTVEGTGNRVTPSPIQQQLTKHYGTQCGYCTSGMIMNMHGLTKKYNGSALTKQIVEDSFDGNMCRCTGYRPILDAFKTFASDSKPACHAVVDLEDISGQGPGVKCPTTGETCFGTCPKPHESQMAITNPINLQAASWDQPKTLTELYSRMAALAGKRLFLVAGHTSPGVYKDGPYDAYIDTKKISDLYLKRVASTTFIGANVTMTDTIDFFNQTATSNPRFSYLAAVAGHIKKIAGTPVRNAATWAGSLMLKRTHPEFPSDIFLCFEVANALITVQSSDTDKLVISPLALLTTNMDSPRRVITSAGFPGFDANVLFRLYKIMPRSQNAHALVNAAFRAQVDRSQPGKFVIGSPALIFGNITGSFNHASLTENYLKGKDIGDATVLAGALKILHDEIKADDVPAEATPAYKQSLSCSLFYKFALEIVGNSANSRFRSAVGSLSRPISSGTQDFPTNASNYPLTQPIPKLESLVQCTGEAKYISDTDSGTMLYAAFAVAERGNADIVKIDSTDAMKYPGVVKVLTAMDIPGVNNINPNANVDQEEALASAKALFAGQPVAVVVGSSQTAAEEGAKLVKVTYANAQTPILTCRDAIDAKSFFPSIPDMVIGDAPTAIKNAPSRVKGVLEIGSQMHFYMETQAAVCTPTDDGMDVESGTQWVDWVQGGVAQCLGVKKNLINVSVKRIGGAYGGKISRGNIIACGAALAAHAVNKPVKMFQSLWDSAKMIGKRNPYYVEYEAGFDANGKLAGIITNVYANCGQTATESPVSAVTLWGDNGYNCPNWKVSMTNCKTNLPANTWTRAPGSTESIFFIEYIMEHIAQTLGKPSIDVKRANFYKNGDRTITGQPLKDFTLAELTDSFLTSASYRQRLQDAATFNLNNRWRKRGISVTPMKYGSTWNGNNFNCFISIFHSGGTVAVSHGGVEMGQGINTKVAQVVAYELGIPLDLVSIKPNFSLTNANANSTGGSVTSELVSLAAINCCSQLKARIDPIKNTMPNASWSDIIEACFVKTIDLSARSWIAPKTTGDDAPVNYNTYGVTCTEVELDVLTGEHQITRMDVIHDCGESMSPLVDVGQIEGAIVMGLGYYTSEELVYEKTTGALVTYSTWKYKPPTTKDIPIDFRVQILQNSSNPSGVLRSKLVAEPPLCMTCSVVFALREAIKAARDEISQGHDWFQINAPMTVEKVQQYCLPDIAQFTYN